MNVGVKDVFTSPESHVVRHQCQRPPCCHQVTEFAFEAIVGRGIFPHENGAMHVGVRGQCACQGIALAHPLAKRVRAVTL